VARVVIYTAPGCHLCGPAVAAVRSVCDGDFTVVDITTDTALERQYRDRIPVVMFELAERFRCEVAEEDLRQIL